MLYSNSNVLLFPPLFTSQAPQNMKLPCLYLLDSIVKNLGGNYPILFENNLAETFVTVFQMVRIMAMNLSSISDVSVFVMDCVHVYALH